MEFVFFLNSEKLANLKIHSLIEDPGVKWDMSIISKFKFFQSILKKKYTVQDFEILSYSL